jgi:hypothetical protein
MGGSPFPPIYASVACGVDYLSLDACIEKFMVATRLYAKMNIRLVVKLA